MVRIILFLSVLTLFSCDPVRRHARLTQKYPYVHTSETKVIHDTIRITNSTSDTVTHYNTLLDTIVLREKQLDVKVYRVRDSIFIEGKCKDTTVVNQYEYKQYSSTETPINWQKIMIILLGLVAIILIINILRGVIKR